MGNKLYVGNLPYSVRDSDLEQAFGQFGAVTSAKVMMERDTGRSKGFGFVEMASDAEAQAAINGMNGQPLGGRSIVVNEARPMEPRPPRTGGFGGALQQQGRWKPQAGGDGDDSRRQRADQVQRQHRPHMCRLPRLVVADGGNHQNKHQHRRHRLERSNKQGAQNGHFRRCCRPQHRQSDAYQQANHNLRDQARALCPAQQGSKNHGKKAQVNAQRA